ncbi:peptidoglycan-binding protein [Actinopolymorpha singaporensis]
MAEAATDPDWTERDGIGAVTDPAAIDRDEIGQDETGHTATGHAATGRDATDGTDSVSAPPRPRRGRRAALVASAVAVVAVAAVAGSLGLGGDKDEGPSTPPRSGSLVPVTRTTLAERTVVDGQLGYGTEIPLPVKATGTVTWLPAEGTTVKRGGTLLRVDDRPVVLMYGKLPMYRDIGLVTDQADQTRSTGEAQKQGTGAGASPDSAATAEFQGTGTGTGEGTGAGETTDPPAMPRELTGMDVLQFETNLAALGYTGFTVDERFTALTASAVRRWQKSLGLPQTGTVDVGDVIYSSGKVRIGHAGVRLGAEASADALTYTGTSRNVVVNASAADAAWAVRGAQVRVELPDGTFVKGAVASVGKQATSSEGGGDEGGSPGRGGDATISVFVTLQDQRALGRLESGPVSVEYVGRKVEDVLSVPVSALVALAEGGYGVETRDGRFLAVKTGLFADGRVEVSGAAIREGMKVRIPE